MKKTILVTAASTALVVAMLGGSLSIYSSTISRLRQDNHVDRTYDKHYVLITEGDDGIWAAVHDSVRTAALENNAYLEWLVPGDLSGRTTEDCMRIAISSKVDGIILHPDGTEGISEVITNAKEEGIPVVTILNDLGTERISFVGVNSYQLGGVYAKEVKGQLQEGDNQIMVLFASSMEDINRNLMYTQINTEIEEQLSQSVNISLSSYTVDTSSNFEAEEMIRDIFIDTENCPDILVCTDSVSTECAYQAMLDYNKVGEVAVIGYYGSDAILSAVRKDLIPSVISINTDEIGKYSVNALEEYRDLGYVSDYFNVDLNIVNGSTPIA